MTTLDLCSYLGLGATGAVTINLLLGMLMSLRYSPVRQWPHRRVNLFGLHQWTAYAAVALTHPAVLLLVRAPHFRVFDILFPIDSPLQPKINLAGAGALYLLLLVFVPCCGCASAGPSGETCTIWFFPRPCCSSCTAS